MTELFIDAEDRHDAVRKIIDNGGRMFFAFVCDDCARFQGMTAKYPPDSGAKSFLCAQCNHFNIGSTYQCVKGHWLRLWIVDDCKHHEC